MWRIVLLAALAVGVVTASTAGAQTSNTNGVLRIGSATAAVGTEAHVPIEVQDVRQPGLGVWDVTITYDPAIVAAAACVDETGNGVCNGAFAADAARLTGAAQNGVTDTAILGEIWFRCLAVGSSQLVLTKSVFTTAVIPPDVVIPQLQDGTMTCAEPTATPQPTSAALPVVTGTPASTTVALPSTGSGGNEGAAPWLPVAPLAAGAAAIGSVAMYRKMRR